ncbi:MAG: molybdopterin-binding protein [Solirubrobacterales bacterium]
MTGTEAQLLQKTELRIERIELDAADLAAVAAAVADVLGLDRSEVIVIDARDDLLALDVLRRTVDPYALLGRREELLAAVGAVTGVRVTERTDLCAEGMLGWIGDDEGEARQALDRARAMTVEIENTIASRAIVFSTGPEVISGQIIDTNKPWIVDRLTEAGLQATAGPSLPDDLELIAAAMREAIEELGYGLVVTTGGVGAEGKDSTVEALLQLDSAASTPDIFTVEAGHGRHVKGCVRIGVGLYAGGFVVCLPGPHAEARIGVEALLASRKAGADKEQIAIAIVGRLRQRLLDTHAGETSAAALVDKNSNPTIILP